MADEDTNSILTDNANRAIQGNASYATWWPTLQTMQMVPPDDQILNQSKLCHLVAKCATNASGAVLLPNSVQVTESISGRTSATTKTDLNRQWPDRLFGGKCWNWLFSKRCLLALILFSNQLKVKDWLGWFTSSILCF